MTTIEILLNMTKGYESIIGVQGSDLLPLEARLGALLKTLALATTQAQQGCPVEDVPELWEQAIAMERERLTPF